MTSPSHHVRTPDESIVDWRRRLLRRAGFPPALAAALARDGRYDLHALIGLTERGCPPALAERILAPVEAAPSGPEE
jgi:hypothetical protein